MSFLDDAERELRTANLSCHAIVRSGNGIYLLYDDSSSDEEKLEPIYRKYEYKFDIWSSTPVYIEDLKEFGFTPENVGQKAWDAVEKEGELIKIILKKNI